MGGESYFRKEQHTMKYEPRKYQSKSYFKRIHCRSSFTPPLLPSSLPPPEKKNSKESHVLLSLFIVSAYCGLTIEDIEAFYQILAKI